MTLKQKAKLKTALKRDVQKLVVVTEGTLTPYEARELRFINLALRHLVAATAAKNKYQVETTQKVFLDRLRALKARGTKVSLRRKK